MKKYLLTFLLMIPSLHSQEMHSFDSNFLESLNDVSEIATKTKLNIDETPSFITVLQSDKLKKLGVRNVFEALSFVPGVQLKKESSGVGIVVFRGATQKGEVKLMIDGVNINNTYRGSIYYYLDFPIELVKRIEVIRGASSILYGSNAISGVINIITNISQYDNQNSVFVSKGSYSSSKIGGYLSTNLSDFKLALDAYSQKNTKTILVGANPSNQTGDSDRHLDDYSFGLNLTNQKISLMARIKKSEIGNAYGLMGVLDKDENKAQNQNVSIYTNLLYKTDLDTNNKISIMATYNRYRQEAEALHPRGFSIDTIYKENSYSSEFNFISDAIKDNSLLVGAKYEYSKTLESEWRIGSRLIDPISNPNLSRKIISLYFNDSYSITEKFNFSAGLRFDHYDDFGNTLNPNLGIVYKLNDKVSFKTLYSHSFRAPSWIELTSNPTLEAEKSNSLEGGIIYKENAQNTLRINVYKSKIENMIIKNPTTKKYVQSSTNNFLGVELEYIYIPNNQLELNFLISHIEAQGDNDIDLEGVSNILASTSLLYETNSGFRFGSVLRYVSSPKRSENDFREKMDDSFVFDQTISYEYKDFTASLLIKDLFDTQTYYALPNNSYQKDFDDGGREVIFSLALDF